MQLNGENLLSHYGIHTIISDSSPETEDTNVNTILNPSLYVARISCTILCQTSSYGCSQFYS